MITTHILMDSADAENKGINVYAVDDDGEAGQYIETIPYDQSLATDEAGYSHIETATHEALRRYPHAVIGDEVLTV
jgi:hypothetical protein